MSICTRLLQSFKYTIIRYKQRHHNDISLYTQWFQSTGINPLVDPVSTHTVQGPVLVPRRDLELVRGQQSLRAAWLGRYPFCRLHTCLLVLVPQQVALFYGDDGGPGLAAQLRVDQVLVVGQRGLWLDVNQGGAVSQVLYTLQLILLHLMLKIQRVC